MIGETLTLTAVQKRYDSIWAVQATDLSIKAGEFVSIVGPSGSGKTTLLTMIAGFENPTSGSIRVGNRDITSLAPNHRDIGMVFQKYALFPHMTVRQNIAFPLRMRHRASRNDARERVDAMLELVRLRDLEDRYPNQLSGGQQQRVAVARALVFDPPVLLMDEPLGALDKKLREAMQFEIKRIQERLGATVIYVTHDQDEALTMSDRVAVMHEGRLEQIGCPSDLYNDPGNAFIADFVGTINFIPGRVFVRNGPAIAINVGGDTLINLSVPDNPVTLPMQQGVTVRLAVRPEQIVLGKRPSESHINLNGTLETIVFSGATRMALVRLEISPSVVIRLQLSTGQDCLGERGNAVTISFAAEAVKLFATGELDR